VKHLPPLIPNAFLLLQFLSPQQHRGTLLNSSQQHRSTLLDSSTLPMSSVQAPAASPTPPAQLGFPRLVSKLF
jgi:hypothetical protein